MAESNAKPEESNDLAARLGGFGLDSSENQGSSSKSIEESTDNAQPTANTAESNHNEDGKLQCSQQREPTQKRTVEISTRLNEIQQNG